MTKKNIVYVGSLRNAAADKAGQYVEYKGEKRYMKSPLEYLVEALNETDLGDVYTLSGVLFDDDPNSPRDQEKVAEYGFSYQDAERWFYPTDLKVQGKSVVDMIDAVPSTYRVLPMDAAERISGKSDFEKRLADKLFELKADVVLLDGLLVILDELIQPGAPFCRKVVNIHPGITCIESPYERRGAYGTLDALYGAKGLKVVDWQSMETEPVEPLFKTGASFHYVDGGIDSGEVIEDVLGTDIDPEDTILELRWNNFNNSLFPAIYNGLMTMAQKEDVKDSLEAAAV